MAPCTVKWAILWKGGWVEGCRCAVHRGVILGHALEKWTLLTVLMCTCTYLFFFFFFIVISQKLDKSETEALSNQSAPRGHFKRLLIDSQWSGRRPRASLETFACLWKQKAAKAAVDRIRKSRPKKKRKNEIMSTWIWVQSAHDWIWRRLHINRHKTECQCARKNVCFVNVGVFTWHIVSGWGADYKSSSLSNET